MALGFIKKVFSFGKKEIEEAPPEDAPLAPLNFEALKELSVGAASVAPPPPPPEISHGPAPAEMPPPRPEPQPEALPPMVPHPVEPDPVPQPEPSASADLSFAGRDKEEAAPSGDTAPTPPPPSRVLREDGTGETQRHSPEATVHLPLAAAPEPVPAAPAEPSAGVAPHPLPDRLPARGETEEPAPPPGSVPAPPAPSPAPVAAAGKVTVSRAVEAKAEPVVQAAAEPRKSWFQRLREGLSRSSAQLTGSIAGIFTRRKLDEETLEELEEVLIRADLGVETALRVTDALASSRYGRDVSDLEVRTIMAQEVEKVLAPVALPLELDLGHKPHVILVVGVNGTGKTTTIGKLAAKLTAGGLKVMLAAGDTFRAAAIEQLKIWGERTGSPVVSSKIGADAAGLAWDAFEKAKAAGSDVLIIDTAGRLQNKAELMAELEKVVRVLGKHDPEAPHTVLQTVDATTGQNALNQVEIFRNVAGVNGLVMTKLDGTARGGILVAIAAKHKLPVYFIGVGEQIDDLEPFSAGDFAKAIAGVA
jgi:fused signal recognition particle receptor